MPYSLSRLTVGDITAPLGSEPQHPDSAGGDSPVMIAAGYNAGPSREIVDNGRGDPRRSVLNDQWTSLTGLNTSVSRNPQRYVMRVTEAFSLSRAANRPDWPFTRFMDIIGGARDPPSRAPHGQSMPFKMPVLKPYNPAAPRAPRWRDHTSATNRPATHATCRTPMTAQIPRPRVAPPQTCLRRHDNPYHVQGTRSH
jgi:hypothetical protein